MTDLGILRAELNDVPIIGRDWYYEPRGWRDVLRCLFGSHRNITIGRVYGEIVCRCSCGAIRYVGGSWFDAHPFRKPRSRDQELSP